MEEVTEEVEMLEIEVVLKEGKEDEVEEVKYDRAAGVESTEGPASATPVCPPVNAAGGERGGGDGG